MTLQTVLAAARIPEGEELLSPCWRETGASMPPGTPDFLQPDAVLANAVYAAYPPEIGEALGKVARAVSADPALTRLAWHCRQLLFQHRDYPAHLVCRWPPLEKVLGAPHCLFYVLIALSAVPLVRRFHADRGIPDGVTRDTVRQHREILKMQWSAQEGRWVGTSMSLYWTRNHAFGDLFAIGRLEYMVRPFTGCVRAFRHRRSGRVIALAEDGIRFGADGYRDVPEDTPCMREGFTAASTSTEDSVTGQYVPPLGRATGQRMTIAKSMWQPVLAPGDPVLDTHIPLGDGMTPDRCRGSMRLALEFFPRYFPERRFAGFACFSWLLNPDLEEMLGPDSNIVKWQRELYLFPCASGPRSGLAEAFGDREPDPAAAPRDTRLRRAMLDRVAAGGRLRSGGMFFLAAELPRYGAQPYRTASR